MENKEVTSLIVENYGIKVQKLEKIKNIYKVYTEDKNYCFKIVKYSLKHFLFILGAMKHLQNNDFEVIPKIITTVNNDEYVRFDKYYAYLTPFISSRECNYDNPIDIELAASKLAELHLKSRNFIVTPDMEPRIGWFKWIETYKTRKNEILDFKKRIEGKDKKTEFDDIFLEMMEDELLRADNAIYHIGESMYISKMMDEINYKGFCHHDYAHHNVLVGEDGKLNIIDFDYCILDTHLHDLASLLIRRMKDGKWDMKNALFILNTYNSIYKVQSEDIPIMASFMEFPQAYWQIGIQYYWEKQPWGEEAFIKKLNRLKEDRVYRQEFIDEFITFKYKEDCYE